MKDSGIEWVGEIPQDKKLLKNKYYISYCKGKNPININDNGIGIAYIGASDLDDNSHNYKIFSTDTDLLTCNENDILILWDGARAGLIGTNHNGIVSSTICKLLLNDKILFHKFFYWYLKGFENYLTGCVNGTTIPHMSKKYIEDINFINWTIEEQKRISAYLDEKCGHIDDIIKGLKKQIELLEEYKKSLITETVTKGLNKNVNMKDSGIEWIGDIPEHWEVKKLKYITVQRNEKGLFKSNQDIYIGLENVMSYSDTLLETSSEYEDSIQSVCHAGDIMFNKLRPYLVKVIIAPYNCFCTGEFLQFCSFNGDNRFLKYFMLSDGFIKIVNASTYGVKMPRANTDFIINLLMTYPPIEEQKAIADYLDEKCKTIDKIISEKTHQIKTIEEYKKSLIFEYVTGKKEL